MTQTPGTFQSIDEYIAQFPADLRSTLELLRSTIREEAPDAEEVISYQMPAFKQQGILVYFALWKEHIGLYPPVIGDKALVRDVSRYAGEKGNLKFPLTEPLPLNLIRRIVRLRLQQNIEKAATRASKSRTSTRKTP